MRSWLLIASLCTAGSAFATAPLDASQLEAPFSVPETNAIHLNVIHSMTLTAARERVGQLLKYWFDRFGIKSLWQGDRVYLSGRAWGFDIEAIFDVGSNAVTATATDPGFIMRGRVASYVQKKLQKYLHPSYLEP